MLTLEKFEEASERLGRVLLETKLVYSDYFSEQTGAKVYFKPENMQFTGAYKLRGAYYKISTLSPEERDRGIISASDDACAYALELAGEKGYTFIHPFNDETVATGQGTIAMEIIKELPTVDYILVPIGGGGLCCGVSTLAKMLNPKIKVIGVEPAGAACMKASLAAGHVVTLPKVTTIADGTAVKTPGDVVFPYIQENVDDIITVEDDDLIAAFLDMMENHKMIVENSGLLTVAALKHMDIKGKKVVSILSGGNMDVITIASVVQNGLIQRDRIFTVSVLLPDKPGELHRVSEHKERILKELKRQGYRPILKAPKQIY